MSPGTELAQYNAQALTAIPEQDKLKDMFRSIANFQALVRENMHEGIDYAKLPGQAKECLLKPGAEKTVRLLSLSDEYTILDRQEDWAKGFFRYFMKCQLVTIEGRILITEGFGECNSYEAKYRWRWASENELSFGTKKETLVKKEDIKWYFPSQVPAGLDPRKMLSRKITTKNGQAPQYGARTTMYRVQNEDIYSQVNTLIKMAEKRALVDAALHAGRLSEIFTQDIDDIIEGSFIEISELSLNDKDKGDKKKDDKDDKDTNKNKKNKKSGTGSGKPELQGNTEADQNHDQQQEQQQGEEMISAGQVEIIKVLVQESGFTSEAIKLVINKYYEKAAAKNLTAEEADSLITHLHDGYGISSEGQWVKLDDKEEGQNIKAEDLPF